MAVSEATIFSYHSLLKAVLRETLSGESMIGIPERSATRAASGSTQKLNSAFGVMFPAPSWSEATAPPMMTSSRTLSEKAAFCRMAVAMFVIGPIATMVISFGLARTERTRSSTAVSFSTFFCAWPPGGGGGASFEYHFP